MSWREIIAMRNRLVHGYFAVDRDILWTVVHDDLPGLITALEMVIGDGSGALTAQIRGDPES